MINEIRERWAKAPDTPWRVFAGSSGLLSLFGKTTGDIIHWAGFDSSNLTNAKKKRDLIEAIAKAPEDIVWLLARVEELEKALKPLLESVERFVWKVENGRARSKESYGQFKEAAPPARRALEGSER